MTAYDAHMQGIHTWCLLRSNRGEPVGAVQLALQLTHAGAALCGLSHELHL